MELLYSILIMDSLETLEWENLLINLAKRASSEIGKEYCLQLPLADNFSLALKLQSQTSEAIELINREGSIPVNGLRNIAKNLADLQKGYILHGTVFLDISSTLRSVRILKKFLTEKQAEDKELYQMVFPLYTNHDFEIRVENSFSSDGTMLDAASPELYRIRQTIRQIQQNIREKLNRMIQDSRYKSSVQENIITQRNGRYVIPIKTEAQSVIKGIVQDQSQSGATVYIEPMSIVDDNNKLAQKYHDEKAEVEKVLIDLGMQIVEEADIIIETVEKMAEFDAIIAKANYSISIKGRKAHLNENGLIDLHKIKHPLLIEQKGFDSVVPIDFMLGRAYDTMIITGSNTGGKTVALKTLGLAALMVKAGLYLPTKTESDMAYFGKVLADIGDEQSLEQNLSTFSGHLLNINKIIAEADQKSLILFDEIGTGTDPSEGAAIARAIIENLREKGSRIVATTHYGELKTLAYNSSGISNASVEFNLETLSPTYKLLLGVPGKSNAIHIARRLGIPDNIIERSRELLSGDEKDVTASIEQLEKEYKKLLEERNKLEILNISLQEKEEEYQKKFAELEERKKKIREKVSEEFSQEAEKALNDVRNVVRDLQRDKSSQKAESSRKEIENISKRFKGKYNKELGATKKINPDINIEKGEYYFLEKINQIVQVISEPRDAKAEVQAGPLKMTVSLDELSKAEGKENKQKIKSLKGKKGSSRVKTVSKPVSTEYRNTFNECDLRGQYVEEALMTVEKFIDESSLVGASPLFIIHGRGTGALKQAVRDHLKHNSLVENFRSGETHEGGEGISVVYLK